MPLEVNTDSYDPVTCKTGDRKKNTCFGRVGTGRIFLSTEMQRQENKLVRWPAGSALHSQRSNKTKTLTADWDHRQGWFNKDISKSCENNFCLGATSTAVCWQTVVCLWIQNWIWYRSSKNKLRRKDLGPGFTFMISLPHHLRYSFSSHSTAESLLQITEVLWDPPS